MIPKLSVFNALKYLIKETIQQNEWLYLSYLFLVRMLYKKWPIQSAADTLVVTHEDYSGVRFLSSNEGLSCQDLHWQLVIIAGNYLFQNKLYNCTEPGIYRFVDPQHTTRQHIVLDRRNPVHSAQLLSLISIRGNQDDCWLPKMLERRAVRRFLLLTCGQNALFCHSIMCREGFKSRIVYSHTKDKLNSYNNGHVLLEVFSPLYQKFVVVDVDKKCCYFRNEIPLSLYELSKAIVSNDQIKYDFYSPLTAVDLSNFKERSTDFNYGFIEYSFYSSFENLQIVISRICQIPMMMADGVMFACAWNILVESRLKEINSSWQCLTPTDFYARFYKGTENEA